MTEWSQLPAELLELISRRLSSEIDLLRFRSVCSTWRSSIKTLPLSPSRFPILPNDGISASITVITWGFFLSKRTIYCIKQPHPLLSDQDQTSWVIKLGHDSPDRVRLLNPLTRCPFKPFPDDFPKFFDFWNLQITELCCEYTLQYINYRPLATSIGDAGTLYMEKVAFCFDPNDGVFTVLTIHVSGKLVLYKSGDTKWTIINDLPTPYDDVIFNHGNFYAVDNTGRMVVLDLDSGGCPGVTVAAAPVFGGDKKFLVKSCEDLLLVDMYMSIGPEDDLGYNESIEFYEEFDCFMSERTVKFKVFRLDRPGKSWIEVSNLGDRVLFLGDNCTFSASVSELSYGGRGNCIIFTDQFFHSKLGDGDWRSGVGVFDLENGSIGPISSYPGYSEVFWPPPDWICPTTAVEANIALRTNDLNAKIAVSFIHNMVQDYRSCAPKEDLDAVYTQLPSRGEQTQSKRTWTTKKDTFQRRDLDQQPCF